ncbi:MAG: class I SAM-dependent methyltransferase [Elusimicrobiota bacterium]
MSCRQCGKTELEELIQCGPQPIGNRFLESRELEEYLHPLTLGQCSGCGIVQLTESPPAEELRPRLDWITYSEPEAHLDALADRIAALEGLPDGAVICGVSFKDDSMLRRMRERGCGATWRVDIERDLGVAGAGAGVETVQARLTRGRAAALAREHGPADVVIARHILEHAFDPREFLAAVRCLGKPGAYVVFEVPDCSASIERLDYCVIWEEHVVYFSPETFRDCLRRAGLVPVYFDMVPYPMENSLIGIGRAGAGGSGSGEDMSAKVLEAELRRGRAFADGFPRRRDALRGRLAAHAEKNEKIALFGAGHLACTFVSLLGLGKYIEFVADDHPYKKGMFMPGSKLPIMGSMALLDRGVRLCLLSLNPNNEEAVISNNREFVDRGGEFFSIFPASKRALKP